MQACHCAGGNYGCLLDGASNVSLTGKIAHFALGTIPGAAKLLRAVAGFLITNYTRQHIITMPRALRRRNVYEEVARLLDIPGRRAIVKESLFDKAQGTERVEFSVRRHGRSTAGTSPSCSNTPASRRAASANARPSAIRYTSTISLAQIRAEIAHLTPDELAELERFVHSARSRQRPVASPEMLAERRRLLGEVMAGEWGTELPPWQETRARDKEKDPWNN